MENNLENLTIGVFAKAAGVNVETIRFYQRKGLLREPDKALRQHPPLWGGGRGSGEIREIGTAAGVQSGRDCRAVAARRWHPLRGGQQHKLKDVREKMADLARMETVLSELVCACHARKGNVSCPLIASLQGEAGLARSAMP